DYPRLRIAEMQIPHSTHRALPARGCPQAYWIVAPDVRIDVFNSPRLQGLKDEVSYSPVNSTSAVLRFRVAVVHIGLLWRWSRIHAEFRNVGVAGADPPGMNHIVGCSQADKALIASIKAFHRAPDHAWIIGPAAGE